MGVLFRGIVGFKLLGLTVLSWCMIKPRLIKLEVLRLPPAFGLGNQRYMIRCIEKRSLALDENLLILICWDGVKSRLLSRIFERCQTKNINDMVRLNLNNSLMAL